MRRRIVVLLVILLLVVAALVVILLSTGPQIGNVFSNIIVNLVSPTAATSSGQTEPLPTRATSMPPSGFTPLPIDPSFQSATPAATATTRELLTATEVPEFLPPTPVRPPVELTATPLIPKDGQPTLAATATPDIVSGDEPTLAATSAPLETAVKVADAALLVRSDVSGEIIGDGTIEIFAPRSMSPAESALVRLELNLDNFYITPTPVGSRGTPPPRATTVNTDGTATPRAPLVTDAGVPVYERMGASLFCSERSFDGCDPGNDPKRAKLITTRRTSWEWTIFPKTDITGLQNLRAEVWIVERNLDGNLEVLGLEGTQYSFQIEINSAGSGLSPWLPVGIVVVLVIAGTGWFLTRRSRPLPVPAVAPTKTGKKPLVFISYRRGSSWAQARSIAQSLENRGADIFIDVDDINEGRFAEIIETTIQRCDYFVPILAPQTLESEWVRREIRSALAANKVIIPLLTDGFRLDADAIPNDIKEIASHNAITLLPEFYEEAISRLASRFLKL